MPHYFISADALPYPPPHHGGMDKLVLESRVAAEPMPNASRRLVKRHDDGTISFCHVRDKPDGITVDGVGDLARGQSVWVVVYGTMDVRTAWEISQETHEEYNRDLK